MNMYNMKYDIHLQPIKQVKYIECRHIKFMIPETTVELLNNMVETV